MKKKTIIASDFDGTLTTKDTMLEFIRHCYGTHGLIIHLLRIMPFLLLMKIKVYPNGKAKERLLRNCFSGKTQTQLSQLAQRFADDNAHLLRQSLLTRLRTAQSEGTEVVIVTASADLWVTKMVPDLTVISTQLEFDDDGIFVLAAWKKLDTARYRGNLQPGLFLLVLLFFVCDILHISPALLCYGTSLCGEFVT